MTQVEILKRLPPHPNIVQCRDGTRGFRGADSSRVRGCFARFRA